MIWLKPFPALNAMNDRQLTRKLFAVLLIKLVLIIGLWWVFIRGNKVEVDSATMAGALSTHPTTQTEETGETRHGH